MADDQPLPSLSVPCRQCGRNMVAGWVGADTLDKYSTRRANLIWIDQNDPGQWTDLTEYRFLKPVQLPAFRCDACGIIELHFPQGKLAQTMRQGFPSG